MNRSLLLAFTLMFIAFAGQAQISKGSVMLGGGISISNVTYTETAPPVPDSHEHYLSFSPAVGIAVKENLIAGVKANYGHSEYAVNLAASQFNSNESTAYGAGLFLRKYASIGKNFYLFGEGDLSYNHLQTISINKSAAPVNEYKTTSKGNSVSLGFNPGLSYAVSRKFHLEAGLGDLLHIGFGNTKVNSSANGLTSSYKKNDFNISSSLSTLSSFAIGFRLFFAK